MYKQFPGTVSAAILWLVFSMAHAQVATERLDINAPYKAKDLDVKVWVERLEVEGREVYDYRNEIASAIGIRPGQMLADVGAGTGLFIPLLAEKTGKTGRVYAVDIVPAFIEHIDQQARERGLDQVSTVLSTERSVELPENSVDIIFTSDAYHHFVYYEDMLASMYRALKPDGQLIIVEFDIGTGNLLEQLVEHVGGTKEEFTGQIEANGFRMIEDFTLEGLEQTFMRRFVKQPS